MLIFRYLAKEVFITVTALTSILLLIFMSNQFVRYLNRAASGQFPVIFLLKLMLLEIPNLMSLLLPLGFYMALIIAYGRLYADSEMTVIKACGYSPNTLLKHSLIMASLVAVIGLIIMLWVSPHVAVERSKLLRASGLQTLIQTIVPGQFRAISNGTQVFFVESIHKNKRVANHVFMAKLNMSTLPAKWDVLWADKVYLEHDPISQEDAVVLQNGRAYQGRPGEANYKVATFGEYKARLPQEYIETKYDVRTTPTENLWPLNKANREKVAELQWRLSVPLMVLILTLIGVPLSRVNPRSGKFAKLLPAVLIYIAYANLIFVARNWIASGKIPIWLGLWWIHLLFACLGFFLIWRDRAKLA